MKDTELSTALKTAIAETATPVESASATPQDTPVTGEEIEGKTGEVEDDKTEKPAAETAGIVLADVSAEGRALVSWAVFTDSILAGYRRPRTVRPIIRTRDYPETPQPLFTRCCQSFLQAR